MDISISLDHPLPYTTHASRIVNLHLALARIETQEPSERVERNIPRRSNKEGKKLIPTKQYGVEIKCMSCVNEIWLKTESVSTTYNPCDLG